MKAELNGSIGPPKVSLIPQLLRQIWFYPARWPDRCYAVTAAVAFLFVVSHTYNQRWQGDFWIHSACIQELATHPFAPLHPLYALERPHEFYSPYAVALGWLACLLGCSSISLLSAMGLVNLLCFFCALRWFVIGVTESKLAAFYALLFTLFLWGPKPLMYSGFFHIQILGDTAPYPSVFCATLSLLAWSLVLSGNQSAGFWPFAFLVPIPSIVCLAHPQTAVSLDLGLAAFWLADTNKSPTRTGLLILALIMQVVCAWVWPYYPFAQLLSGDSNVIHDYNRWVYLDLTQKYWPVLLLAPLLAWRLKRNRRDSLVSLFVVFLAVFVFGYCSGMYTLGRNIAYLVLILHVAGADWMAKLEQTLSRNAFALPWWTQAFHVALQVLVIALTCYFVGVGMYRYRPGRECTYSTFIPLRQFMENGKVVMTDLFSGNFIPSLGGKIVASEMHQCFVSDHRERQADLKRFFSTGANLGIRLALIKKYKVDFVLLNLSAHSASGFEMAAYERLGPVVYRDGKIVLIAVGEPKDRLGSQPH